MKTFKTVTYPKSRVATFDVGKIGRSKHHITGLLEIDVTLARQKVSLTSWFVKVIGKTICENREILHLTVTFDHDAVDGVPAALFTKRLVTNMERAAEL